MTKEEFSDEEFELDNNELEEFEEFDPTEEGHDEMPEKTEEDLEKSKLARKEQKQLQLERKMKKPNSDIIQEAKLIWEQLRQKKINKKERQELMDKMMNIVSGKALDVFHTD